MRTKIIRDVGNENGRRTVHLASNYNIQKIIIALNNFSPEREIFADINYAQNEIITDLISLAQNYRIMNSVVEFVPDNHISASDLYITFSDENISIKEMVLCLADDFDLSRCYPAYIDYNLEKNYFLDTVTVFMPSEGYAQYSLFTSINGKDFELVARKTSEEGCPAEGETHYINGKEAGIIRLFVEYNSASCEVCESKIEFKGEESGREAAIFQEPFVEDFESSVYNCEVTPQHTVEAVYSIIERNLGAEYVDWFSFELVTAELYDFFEICNKADKICITANNGVSLSMGLNYYLKYFLKINISQVGSRIKMPCAPVLPKEKIHRETRAKYRYAYNYCTLSYTMSFWDEERWQKELDWLALNGVNLVLDITAQEEVWRRFLKEIGYSHQDIKKFIAGPGYYAWAYMGNLYGFGGPVHDDWFKRSTELARKNHLYMRKLGIKPVLQGYCGMIPCDIEKYDKNACVIPQGTWCSFQRPYMLKTTSPCFKEYAKKFYKAQREVYGNISNCFAADPFHEGGITLDMRPCEIAEEVLSVMTDEVADAIWVVQSWQRNPTSELLKGIENIGREHALILDLYAEKDPNYSKGSPLNPSHGYQKEFNHTPWLYCMLNNFGGRDGLHGNLTNIERDMPDLLTDCESIAGIGITPEASYNNPVLYDYFFEVIWVESCNAAKKNINMDGWISEYALRRYGANSENIKTAWQILLNTVYKSSVLGQGAPESVINARPSLYINSASNWGTVDISYDKCLLGDALDLFMKEYDVMKHSEGYRYDVITVILQVLSNSALDVHKQMSKAFVEKNYKEFCNRSDVFLKIAELTDNVASQSEYHLLGVWTNGALKLAEGYDDFTRMRYLMNANCLVTTWGAYNQSEAGGLHDYSNRQWAGLTKDFYMERWQMWIDERKKELLGSIAEKTDWFKWEWEWARNNKIYADLPSKFDLKDIFNELRALR